MENKINNEYSTFYHYITKGYRTSFMLDRLKVGQNEFSYQYDILGNITDVFYNNTKTNHYVYDDQNELIRDDDYRRNITSIYTYDSVGNLLKKQEYNLETEELVKQDVYMYSNDWEDQLIKFNNINITYDEIGNPLTIGEKQFTWINGRQLQSIHENDSIFTYEYNKDSIRTKKTVNGEITHYYLEEDHILFENTKYNIIYYLRDSNQNLIGFRYNGDTYYYLKNALEDIIGILDSNYNIIANYQYDAWGKIISITNANGIEITDTTHIAYKNPFRYRSYYYDSETGYYYLNSRYYDPTIGRFINSDSMVSTGQSFLGHNMYAYTENNPVCRIDVDGGLWFQVAGAFFGGVIGIGSKMLSNASEGKNLTDGIIGSGLSGAFNGFLMTVPFGQTKTGFLVANYGGAFIESSVNSFTSGEKVDANQFIMDTTMNGFSATKAGKIANKAVPINPGWIRPQKFKKSFTGNYSKKVRKNMAVQSSTNYVTTRKGNSGYSQKAITNKYSNAQSKKYIKTGATCKYSKYKNEVDFAIKAGFAIGMGIGIFC